MKPLLISTSDINGGAARATYRLHRGLRAANIESSMLVANKQSDDWTIEGISGNIPKTKKLLNAVLEEQLSKLQITSNPVLHSPSKFSSLKAKKINATEANIIHLNWVGKSGLSVDEISKINKPTIWTLHDMWAFTGSEHYTDDIRNSRWRNGYTHKNRDVSHKGLDIDRWTWLRKQKLWNKPIQIVTPSLWLANCVKTSALMHNWPVKVIPNVLDTNVYQPTPKIAARKILGLPLDKTLILFGALDGSRDPRKGWDLLHPALEQLKTNNKNFEAVIVGQQEPKTTAYLPNMPLHWMGHIHDDFSLALIYSASDVTVVPSRQEAFGQTASEAQACGCPVVAFNTTGLTDVVDHKKTGYLAQPFSSEDLALGIHWVVDQETCKQKLGKNARKKATTLWSEEMILPQYLQAYTDTIDQYRTGS